MATVHAKIVVEEVFSQFVDEYEELPDGKRKLTGKLRPITMVKYRPFNDRGVSSITARWDDLEYDKEKGNDPHSVLGAMARSRYETIKPYIDAFERNVALPEQGTPIGQWPMIDRQRAEIMRGIGLRTIEELADANDTTLSKIPLPDMRTWRQKAKDYIASSDRARITAETSATRIEVDALKAQNEELRQMLESLLARSDAARAPAVVPASSDLDDIEEAVRNEARALGIGRVGNKSIDTLRSEIAEARRGRVAA